MDVVLDLYMHMDMLMLIFCRILFAILFIPIMTQTNVAPMVKGGLSLILSLIVFATLDTRILGLSDNAFLYGILLMKECIVGLILGFTVLIFFQTYYFVGQLLSVQGGMSMNSVMDQDVNSQVPVLGKFYYLGFCAVFVLSGGYHWLIREIVESFNQIGVGQAVYRPQMTFIVVEAIAIFFKTSFLLAAPLLSVLFIVDCGLAILAKTVPQMNMFVIGMPLKSLILFWMMILTIGLVPTFNNIIIKYIVQLFESIVQGMIP